MDKKYLIVTPGYNSLSGGIKVLHRLAHLLGEQGYDAYVTAGGTPDDWAVMHLEDLSIEDIRNMQENDVVVYPDVVWGNPLKFNNCVQYDLQKMRPIQTNMLGVSLEHCFTHKVKPDLTMMIIYMEEFFELPKKNERKGICYYKGKGKTECPDSDWLNIVNVSREDLAYIYQTSELLVCADNMTQTTIEARLCGCPVKMIEPSMLPWNEYRDDYWGMKGIIIENDKSIEQAIGELPEFKEYYDFGIDESKKELSNFIETTQNRQVEYIPLELGFHPGMFGISPQLFQKFNERR